MRKQLALIGHRGDPKQTINDPSSFERRMIDAGKTSIVSTVS